MNKKDYIGYDLAKHLQKKGFKGESEYYFFAITDNEDNFIKHKIFKWLTKDKCPNIPTYSYYQIITELAEELFGEASLVEVVCTCLYCKNDTDIEDKAYIVFSKIILEMLQSGKPQKEIDKYILNNLTDKYK